MRSQAEVDLVLELHGAGLNNSEISRRTGISRATFRPWLSGNTPGSGRRFVRHRTSCPRCSDSAEFLPGVTVFAYAYLLGLYLGDGLISNGPRNVYRLRVFLDRAYPVIVAECGAAMSLVMPSSKVGVYSRRDEKSMRSPRTRVIGHAYSPNTVPGRSTTGASPWSPGSNASLSAFQAASPAV